MSTLRLTKRQCQALVDTLHEMKTWEDFQLHFETDCGMADIQFMGALLADGARRSGRSFTNMTDGLKRNMQTLIQESHIACSNRIRDEMALRFMECGNGLITA